ncbi:WbqC family protein [Phormidium tenue]|uniref:WbqC family protein n=1 Tax=Phormidium tenue NIES-30 TaxID=549789 RepID=A0A1U7IYB1_9CYAN|nr:WbqC family protein [Phormidium tenue]MBD2234913.1 WbqC family protein [Phormidium tenue FACHB-1052]OKH43453.1 hypothetical protein NIES30_24905 [Phormidium tenue NIES-30]
MRVVVHQPYFLPWLGYFSKLAFSDAFIILDDVNFRKRHYYDRTRIVNMHGEIQWLGLPVGENFRVKCCDVIVRDDSFRSALVATIAHSYAKALKFEAEIEPITQILLSSICAKSSLVKVNIDIILSLLGHLKIPKPQIFYSSSFAKPEDATARIVALCQQVNASEIVIGGGSSIDIHNWQQVRSSGIRVFVQDYMASHPIYQQTRRRLVPFQPGLSIIDSLLNVGSDQTYELITSSIFTPQPFEE